MRYLILLSVVLTLGCGSGGPFSYKKVNGTISYDDGSAVPGVVLRFVALDAPKIENATPRPAFANADSQGKFDCVTSYKYGDGLIPGKHKVVIEVDPNAKPVVPKEYTNVATTPLEVDTADSPFDIKVTRPKGKH